MPVYPRARRTALMVASVPEFTKRTFSTEGTASTTISARSISRGVGAPKLVPSSAAVLIAPMLDGLDQIFQYIQEYTGMVSPGILAVFLLGLFWKKTTNNAAIWGVLASLAIALFFKFVPISGLEPWMHQMGLTFILTSIIIVVISYMDGKGVDSPKGIVLTKELFKTSPLFNIGAFVVMIILVVLYSLFWN